MNNLFQRTSSSWARYSEYKLKEADGEALYVIPKPRAKPDICDPLKNAEASVVDALNVGMLCTKRVASPKIQAVVMEFVLKYGLLGFMTALPTSPQFMDYDTAYLPANHFVKDETRWNINNDRGMMVLAAAYGNSPMAINMSLQRE